MTGTWKRSSLLLLVILCRCLGQSTEWGTPAHTGGEAVLHEGTPVMLAFTANLSSRTAKQGDTVKFVLVNDLTVGGAAVAKAGAKALGHLTYVRKAAAPGKSGALTLQMDYLHAGNKKVPLTASKKKGGETVFEYSRPYRLKWPMGLFRTGDDAEIHQGSVLAAYVAEDVCLQIQE